MRLERVAPCRRCTQGLLCNRRGCAYVKVRASMGAVAADIVSIDCVRSTHYQKCFNHLASCTGGATVRMWHGTRALDPAELLLGPYGKDGICASYSDGGFYGRCTYASPHLGYVMNGFATRLPTGNFRVLLVDVMPGNSMDLGLRVDRETMGFRVAPVGPDGTIYHSVHGGPHRPGGPDTAPYAGTVYGLYHSSPVLPLFVVEFKPL